MSVLSIQSAVTYGHVGNSAARPILQAMGHAIWAVDTVVFSNHPGHGRFRGRMQDPADLAELLIGLAELQIFGQVRAVLSGYLGDAANGPAVARAVTQVKAAAPSAMFVLDPVMGDFDAAGIGRTFVGAGVPETILDDLLPLADLITPNRFELTRIAGRSIATADEAIAALCELRALLARPALTAIVTGFDAADVPLAAIDTLILTAKGSWRVRQPRLARRFDGAGDAFTALLLANLLAGAQTEAAAAQAVSAIAPILADAARRGAKDLDLMAFLPGLRSVTSCFAVEPIHG